MSYHPDDVESTAAWRRLRQGVGRRPGRFQVLAAVLLFLLGLGVVTQAQQTSEAGLSTLRETELVRLLDGVSERRQRLEEEASDLQAQRQALLTSSDASAEAERAARERLAVYSILAGTVAAQGPGVTLVIRADDTSVVDAAFLLDTLQELRDAGAEAVQIGDVRVVASTAFTADPEGRGVLVDGTLVTSPYTIRAIGDPDVLEPALRIPGGVVPRLTGAEGVTVTVTELELVLVDALRGVTEPEYARPAQPEE